MKKMLALLTATALALVSFVAIPPSSDAAVFKVRTQTATVFTSQGQLNKNISLHTFDFDCKLAGAPVAYISPADFIDTKLSLSFASPSSLKAGVVTVMLTDALDPNARAEFVPIDIVVSAVCILPDPPAQE